MTGNLRRTGKKATRDLIETASNRSQFLVREPPLQEELMIGTSSLHLLVGCLDGTEQRGVVLAHGNPFGSREHDGAANFKLIRTLFDIVVRDRRVLVGRHRAVTRQQLDQ